jgi:hypothetical protein
MATIKRLQDPAFLEWVTVTHGMPVTPEQQDFDLNAAHTTTDRAEQYCRAVAHKLIRLYEEWKAERRKSERN